MSAYSGKRCIFSMSQIPPARSSHCIPIVSCRLGSGFISADAIFRRPPLLIRAMSAFLERGKRHSSCARPQAGRHVSQVPPASNGPLSTPQPSQNTATTFKSEPTQDCPRRPISRARFSSFLSVSPPPSRSSLLAQRVARAANARADQSHRSLMCPLRHGRQQGCVKGRPRREAGSGGAANPRLFGRCPGPREGETRARFPRRLAGDRWEVALSGDQYSVLSTSTTSSAWRLEAGGRRHGDGAQFARARARDDGGARAGIWITLTGLIVFQRQLAGAFWTRFENPKAHGDVGRTVCGLTDFGDVAELRPPKALDVDVER